MKRQPIASAKPGQHKVRVKRRTYVYARVRIRELTESQSFIHIMRQIAKETLRRVKNICQHKPTQNGSDLHQ